MGLLALGFLGFFLWTRQFAVLKSPEPTLLLEDRNGQFLSEAGSGPLGFWPVGEVPERLEACLLTAEDRRFYQHSGIDLKALVRAFLNNIRGKPRQGASTIPMQIARLQRPGPRTYARKIEEMGTAWHLVQRYGQARLLDHYLRLMPQGRRIHGASYSARRYFHKPLVDISWAEAALLTALPRAPGRMNFYRPDGLQRAKSRATHILQTLHRQKGIGDQDLIAALRQLKNYTPPERELRPFHALHAIHRIQQSVVHQTNLESTRPIRTTLDLPLQSYVDGLAADTLENLRGLGAGNIAVMVVERENGAIRSYIGSDWYDDQSHAGAINFAAIPRSSGSTLKPFLFALGLETGEFQPNSILADLPLLMVDSSGHYGVTNFDASHLGPMLYRRALANSRNIPAVNVLRGIGIDRTYAFLNELGLGTKGHSAEFYGLGMAIGGIYVSLEDLIAAYTTLANDGKAIGLHWFPEPQEPSSSRVISETTARQINMFLADPQAREPSFPRGGALEYSFPVAVKTGTSQGFRDAWCLAYSRDYLVGVWIGRPDHQPMNKVSGVRAAKLVKTIMTHLHPQAVQGVGIQPFANPRHAQPTRLCGISGHLASPECDQVALEYLPPQQKPPLSQVHQRFAIDGKTGRQAGPSTPTDRIKIRKALVLPGAYSVWAARQGYAPPQPPTTLSKIVELKIQVPVAGSRLHLDPSTPKQFQTLPLRAVVEPAVAEIVWYVDGKPFKTVGYPYETRWQLQPGRHTFQIRLPRARIQSDIISIQIFP